MMRPLRLSNRPILSKPLRNSKEAEGVKRGGEHLSLGALLFFSPFRAPLFIQITEKAVFYNQ
jgi:hypothetical protein